MLSLQIRPQTKVSIEILAMVTDIEQLIIERIFKFFVHSRDFNGISLQGLAEEVSLSYLQILDEVKGLVEKKMVIIQSTGNPHIIGLEILPVEDQLKILDSAKQNKSKEVNRISTADREIVFKTNSILVCVYPSQEYLTEHRNISQFSHLPFTGQLAIGHPQLAPLFFELEVLDRYYKDPRYSFQFRDYSGQISYVQDENNVPLVTDCDQVFLQSFGLGVDGNLERVAVVYLRYLKDLTSEHQIFWKSKEVKRECRMLVEYYVNTIEGNWTTSHSVFSAFIEEQKALNDLSKAIFGQPLFNNTYERENRPKEFTFFFIPTLRNYHDFVLLLDKMISDNINKGFFECQNVILFDLNQVGEFIERTSKGTLRLLEDWLAENFYSNEKQLAKDLLKPFKLIRKERQVPAHKINENIFDKSLVEKQKELIKAAYFSMHMLRKNFQRHPNAAGVEVTNWLDAGKVKIF